MVGGSFCQAVLYRIAVLRHSPVSPIRVRAWVITGHRTMAGQATTSTLATPIKPPSFPPFPLFSLVVFPLPLLFSTLSSFFCVLSLSSVIPLLSLSLYLPDIYLILCVCVLLLHRALYTTLDHCTNAILVLLLIGLIPPAFHEIFPSFYSSPTISIGLLFVVPFFSSSHHSIPGRSPWASSEMFSTTLFTPRN